MELSQDLEEVRQLLVQARRDNSRRVLTAELARLEALRAAEPAAPKPAPAAHRVYETKLSDYAWDQSDKFVKFYVNVKNVQTVPEQNIQCTYTDNSFTLRIESLDNKNYNFAINNLLHPINTSASKFKVKQDSVLVMLAKRSAEHWSHVTGVEKQAEEARTSKLSPGGAGKEEAAGADPAAGIMDLMKKMYDDGDDEMKRTIMKAWSESRDKQMTDGGGML
ncbi:calcyclin-binding protein-like [Pollicipes pollicipes]|uniref:calcyclin-binding protein-like n=1 Tax=Pollicipes pollicipes TaxID=41117 RepID=UPI001884ED1B|nr:calcyclin-binding protein-like [Pollicipes pollicipes]XP_037074716.1 calcyclin-binding protein-like [Pollicipes pollicipes]